MSEDATSRVVERLYEACFVDDPEEILAEIAPGDEVHFLERGVYRGIDEARRFLSVNTGMPLDLDFRIRRLVVEGELAAVAVGRNSHDDPRRSALQSTGWTSSE